MLCGADRLRAGGAAGVRPAVRAGLGRRRRLRDRRGLAGEVPPLRRAGAGRRRRRRHLPHLRLAVGARPRGHPAAGRDRHHRPLAARPALAAEAAARRSPRDADAGGARLRRGRDLIIAVACGLGIAGDRLRPDDLAARPRASPTWFLEHAYVEGGGTNVVNVILVDFRGFDTFGEITVLAIVALSVFALLRRFRPAQESVGLPEQQRVQDALRRRARGPQPRRHGARLYGGALGDHALDVPGDHHAVGLPVPARPRPAGRRLRGRHHARDRLPAPVPRRPTCARSRTGCASCRCAGSALGLLVAAATGIGAWLFGYPFLTAHARYLDLPLIGEVPVRDGAAVRPRRLPAGDRRDRADPDRHRPPVAALAAAGGRRRDARRRGGRLMEAGARARDRGAGRLGRLAAAAPAHLPGDHRPGAAVLRRQPLHLRDGSAAGRRGADPRQGRARSTRPPSPTRCRRRWCSPRSSSASPRRRCFSWC